VKRLFALLLGGFGAAAWWQRRRRRTALLEESSPADELRARLAETRGASEPEPDAAPELDPESRRRAVHEQARQRLDELA
jgi:hypothetical protein